MEYTHLDRYSETDSYVHRLDARTKFLYALVFILFVVLTPPGSWLVFAFYAVITTALVLSSKIPPLYIIKRSLLIEPFILLVAIFVPFLKEGQAMGSITVWSWHISVTHEGVQLFLTILAKSWLSILTLLWLTSTTKITHILYSFERLHFPRVLVMILSFMYRYIFVIVDEMMRMKQARDSRNIGIGIAHNLRTFGHMIGTLFVRSYERSERVYEAMVSRGFDGEVRVIEQLKFSRTDAAFGITFGVLIVAAGILNLVLY